MPFHDGYGAPAQAMREGLSSFPATGRRVRRPAGLHSLLVWSALVSSLLLTSGASICAQTLPQPGPRDPAEMATFFDGLYSGLERAHHLSGMTLAVVRDGKVLLLRGYGHADIEKRTPVDPEHTLFRVGSISKTFIWISIMQLVAAGRLDLNAPIDQFMPDDLDVRSPWHTWPTMRNLMTHTPGYEDVPIVGLFRHAPFRGSLEDALRESQPVMVRKPGTMVSYSNYGSAQAGYILERVSGISVESYVENQIFRPLGMDDATFRQPLPDELAPHMAVGYEWADGELKPQGFEYVPLAPAGACSASAAAMARFMIAQLQDGRYGDEHILPEWTARRMREPLYRAAPQLGAWLYGFYEMRPAGPRVYGHNGSTLWFHSLMALFPESGTGLFFSINSDTGRMARDEIYKAFLNRYYPQPELVTPALLPGAAARSAACAGWYGSTRVPRRTEARIIALGAEADIRQEGPGHLVAGGPAFQTPLHLVEIEPWVYREARGQELVVFQSKDGKAPRVFNWSANPGAAYERTSWLLSPPVQTVIAGLGLIGVLIALFGYPVALLRYRTLHREIDMRVRAAHAISWMAAVAFSVGIGGVMVFLQDVQQLAFGLPTSLVVAAWAGRVACALAVISAASAVILWSRRMGGFGGRLAHTLAVLCQAILGIWAARWGLLG